MLLASKNELNKKIDTYLHDKQIFTISEEVNEIKGHLEKAGHNLRFVEHTTKTDFSDWVLVGCYYTLYHAALALLLKKGLFSKNHDATLCLLIREYYKEFSEDEFELINFTFLNNEDILFYIHAKDKREQASYSTKIAFKNSDVNLIVLKTRLLFNKAKEIITSE
ncbi:HEPN domain-containing protein [Candidatus Woesearchaeota archaeon]|nr:HEPN domain-containing protein [Candidatus Woesearchaeota archaeon]